MPSFRLRDLVLVGELRGKWMEPQVEGDFSEYGLFEHFDFETCKQIAFIRKQN